MALQWLGRPCRCLLNGPTTTSGTRSYAAAKKQLGGGQKSQKGKQRQQVKRGGGPSSSYSRNRVSSEAEDRRFGGGGGGGSRSGGINIGPLNSEWFRSAPALRDLAEIHPDDHLSANSLGHARLFPRNFEKAIEVFGCPESVKYQFGFTARPASILRQSTMDVLDALDLSTLPRGEPADEPNRGGGEPGRRGRRKETMTLVGARGTGKSYLILQALSYALTKDWIVYYHPDVTRWVNSSYPYRPTSNTSQGETAPWNQDALALSILQALYKVNGSRLEKVQIPRGTSVGGRSSGTLGSAIQPLVNSAAADADKGAQEVLGSVFDILRGQNQVPFLIVLDGVNSLFRDSLYNNELGQPIPGPDMSVPRLFLEYMTGRKAMQSGMTLSALSATLPPPWSNTPELLDALYPNSSLATRTRALTSHRPLYAQLALLLQSNRKRLTVMDEMEARGLYGLLIDAQCTGARSSEESFLRVWSESTGNPRLFTKSAFTQGMGL